MSVRIYNMALSMLPGLRLYGNSMKCVFRSLNSHLPKLSYSTKHPETPQFPNEFTTDPPKGKIYDKKPFRIELQAGKNYSWCACGHSHKQPFCDGTHKSLWGTSERKMMPKWQPHRFRVEETKEYWLCNCKQTNKRPFCDGTHKNAEIQAKIK